MVHGAFRFGYSKTVWTSDVAVRAMYNLFHDSPARRSIFTEITGSKEYPPYFCATRWLENGPVYEKAIAFVPNLKKYCDEVRPRPDISSFKKVNEAVNNDKFFVAQLEFLKFFCGLIQPFLKKYQTSEPVLPFMPSDLKDVLRNVLKLFVKNAVV